MTINELANHITYLERELAVAYEEVARLNNLLRIKNSRRSWGTEPEFDSVTESAL
jgi:hypothetical protein